MKIVMESPILVNLRKNNKSEVLSIEDEQLVWINVLVIIIRLTTCCNLMDKPQEIHWINPIKENFPCDNNSTTTHGNWTFIHNSV